ncbi:MAG: DUF21 domain-containing protein, partial [Anaerolineae bacterium]|nr:DUF21 domain-containing protein [Anaerolineae bacterium]
MDDSIAGLVSIFGLILLQAIVTLAYASVTNTKMAKMRDWSDANTHSTRETMSKELLTLAGSKNLLITYQTITALLQFIIASITLLNVATPLLAQTPDVEPNIIYFITLALSLFLSLSLGNIVPEAIGSRYSHALASFSFPLMRFLLAIFSPMVFAMIQISTRLSALFKSEGKVNTVTEEEIMTVVEA